MRTLSWIILIVWVAAFFRTILNLIAVKRLPSDGPDDGPLVSIIIPARNEERNIEHTVRSFLAQTYRNIELIVVDDRSTDATAEILRSIADRRLMVIDGEEPPAGWLGKPWALHIGSSRASGEILLFVDADILYAPKAIAAAVATFREAGVPMVTLLPKFEMVGFWENVAIPNLAVFLFSFAPLWLSNRTRVPFLALGGGTGNMIARRDYEAVEGHQALKDAVVDDVGLGHLMRVSGRSTLTCRADDLVSVRIYHGACEIIDGFTKNMFAAFRRSYFLTFLLVVVGILSGIVPYALALSGDGISLAAVCLISATRVILFRSLRYSLLYATFAHPLMAAFWAYIFLRSMWFTGVRNQVRWRGRTYDAAQTRSGTQR